MLFVRAIKTWDANARTRRRSEKEEEKNELENKLTKKKNDQKKHRKQEIKIKKIKALFEDNPELRISLNLRAKSSKPRIEKDQSLLLETIVNIAMKGSASHERSQSNVQDA